MFQHQETTLSLTSSPLWNGKKFIQIQVFREFTNHLFTGFKLTSDTSVVIQHRSHCSVIELEPLWSVHWHLQPRPASCSQEFGCRRHLLIIQEDLWAWVNARTLIMQIVSLDAMRRNAGRKQALKSYWKKCRRIGLKICQNRCQLLVKASLTSSWCWMEAFWRNILTMELGKMTQS